ncbi:MAG: hypothetical protein DI628_05305 [Blastochloris viridis]|uniref:Uncharacterized protein n=1 Tax=Blastochloris viridis TaxID=1079 RepID=A0A6N4REC4_BLAVI|nr:MAG: hypothetical protein DI628_05305 [Blastochloris viridis]
MGIYDKTIDPLSAPKAISEESFQTFHQLGIELRQKDLAMMKRVLEETPKYMEVLVEQEITKTQEWYATFEHLVDQAYQQAGLTYDAEENPFIG